MRLFRTLDSDCAGTEVTLNSRMRVRTSAIIVAIALVACLSVIPSSLYAQPAPPLRSLVVVAVKSPTYRQGTQWDYVNSNTLTTKNDHGGDWIIVAVEEKGYAKAQYAEFNGRRMTLEKSEQVVSGGVITGWIRYYSLKERFTSGRFTNRATSINFPRNTISTGLNIK